MSSLRVSVLIGSISLVACGSSGSSDTEDGSSSSSSSSASNLSNSNSSGGPPPPPPPPATSTTAPTEDDTTYGNGCGPNPCEPCPDNCEPYPLCIASKWTCDCICEPTGTGGPDVCDSLQTAVDIWVEPSLNPPVDCGLATPEDDQETWQAVHDCVAMGLAGGPFRAQWETADEPPAPRQFAVAARFVKSDFERVWYEVSGEFTLTEYTCSAMTVTPKCEVDVGQMCLTCERQAEAAVLCTDR